MKIFNESSIVYFLEETVYNSLGEYYADEEKYFLVMFKFT